LEDFLVKRRDLVLTGTAALAVAGLAQGAKAATTTTTVTATPKTTPTIFDFGAKGDGVTDDSTAFTNALKAAATSGRKIVVPGYTYAIAKTIAFSSTANSTSAWGLSCQGAILQSKITNGTDVMNLVANNVVRYFGISGGLSIKGTKTDRNGLRIFATGTSSGKYFYNCTLDGVSIEGCGNYGLLMEGNVFENSISNCFFQDNKLNGATFAHSQSGVCSAITIVGSYFNQNGQHGLEATNFDGQYGGAQDVRVYGGYCRENKKYGFRYNNGTAPGAAIQQVGFENNYTSVAPGDPTGAHVFGQVRMNMRNCTGYNQFGGATYLLNGYWTDLVSMDGCNQSAGAAMAATGKSRLARIYGSNTGHVVMRDSQGGIDIGSGNAATWQAINCSGTSPLGNLSMRSTIGSV
jgi:hypothetical protein